jgi:16S rRNA (cytosine1402-N4)-methyltransferase
MHEPVLLKEVFNILKPVPGEFFVDGTLGMAGHAKIAIQKINPNGLFLGLDRDSKSLEEANKILKEYTEEEGIKTKILLSNSNFNELPEVLANFKVERSPDCILLDLGFSSFQIFSERGFSYDHDEPLIMRYDGDVTALTAARVVNEYDIKKLTEILKIYGEERFSERIAGGIVQSRRKNSLRTTKELKEAVISSLPKNYPNKKRPEARTFLALRNYINHEPEDLKTALNYIPKILAKNGRAGIITFNSLEDKIVKKTFKDLEKNNLVEILTKKPIKPTQGEINKNKRSRSAKLRVIKLK